MNFKEATKLLKLSQGDINDMDDEEKVILLEEAQRKIWEAIENIEQAVRGTDLETTANAYIISHLRNWAEGTDTHDDTIPVLIKAFGGELRD